MSLTNSTYFTFWELFARTKFTALVLTVGANMTLIAFITDITIFGIDDLPLGKCI
jgi:hypothetical protein